MDTQPDETEAACDDQRASQTAPSSSTDADMEAPPGSNANDVRKGLAKYLQDLKGRLFRARSQLLPIPSFCKAANLTQLACRMAHPSLCFRNHFRLKFTR